MVAWSLARKAQRRCDHGFANNETKAVAVREVNNNMIPLASFRRQMSRHCIKQVARQQQDWTDSDHNGDDNEAAGQTICKRTAVPKWIKDCVDQREDVNINSNSNERDSIGF